MENIRVIVVDREPLFASGIRAVLENNGNCTVVGIVSILAEAQELIDTTSPDVALVDSRCIEPDTFVRFIRGGAEWEPRMALIVLATIVDEEEVFQSFKVGAAAYLTRDISSEELVEVVQKVNQGIFIIENPILTPSPASSLFPALRGYKQESGIWEEDTPRSEVTSPTISARELEILGSIARGNSNKEIAKSLKISDQTVKNHITSILKKLSVVDRTSAVVHALGHGWITLESTANGRVAGKYGKR